MIGPFSLRLLTLFQFTRMALVFTAISNLQASYVLSVASPGATRDELLARLDPWVMVAFAMISIGLYGFGMALNDIVDHRRDLQIAADRPLPSGRLGIHMAHVVCSIFGLLAALGGWLLTTQMPNAGASLMVLAVTGMLIVFYDVAGKYLVAVGLLSLGVIRFMHALIADPTPEASSATFAHALFLLVHVTAISAVAYALEQKRPSLTRPHVLIVLAGTFTVIMLTASWLARDVEPGMVAGHLGLVGIELVVPLTAAIVFVLIAHFIRQADPSSRSAGKNLMLLGLLWLIVYDAAFVSVYAHWTIGLTIALLLPLSYCSVRFMRLWSKVLQLSQPPAYLRAP